jgi:hypothetical protein
MNPIDMIPLMTSNNPEVGKSWGDICREGQAKQDAWVAALREQGISAAHPDDGWVNRTTNEINFVYPQFKDALQPGSLVALGWPDRHRIVELTDLKVTQFGSNIWTFRSAQ